MDIGAEDLETQLAEWQRHYNWERGHDAPGGKIPIDRFLELIDLTPFWDEGHQQYNQSSEQIQDPTTALT